NRRRLGRRGGRPFFAGSAARREAECAEQGGNEKPSFRARVLFTDHSSHLLVHDPARRRSFAHRIEVLGAHQGFGASWPTVRWHVGQQASKTPNAECTVRFWPTRSSRFGPGSPPRFQSRSSASGRRGSIGWASSRGPSGANPTSLTRSA